MSRHRPSAARPPSLDAIARQLTRLSDYPEFEALVLYAREYSEDLLIDLQAAHGPEALNALHRWQAAVRFLSDIGIIKEVQETENARRTDPDSDSDPGAEL